MFQNITAETAEASIIAPVLKARQKLAKKAAEFAEESSATLDAEFYLRGDELVGLAQNVATTEALMTAQLRYLSVCKNKPENRMKVLFDIVGRGADDSWSGRRNDSKRASFDAVRSWATDQAFDLRFEDGAM